MAEPREGAWHWVHYEGWGGEKQWVPAQRVGNHWNSATFRGIPLREADAGPELTPRPDIESLTEEKITRLAFERYGIVADDAEVVGFAREILGRAMAEMRAKVHEMTGTAGKTLVDAQALRDCLALIDPPPMAKGDGTGVVFVNPMAAQAMTALSAAVRRLTPPGG